jgi:hypothetical protein
LSSSKAADPKVYRLEPTMPHPDAIGTAQKETDLIPKLNRMPDGSLGVKVDAPNCPGSTIPETN